MTKDLDFAFNNCPDIVLSTCIIDYYSSNIQYQNIYFKKSSNFIALILFFKKFDILQFHGFTPKLFLYALFSGKNIYFTNHGLLGSGRTMHFKEKTKNFLLKFCLKYFVKKIINNSKYSQERLIKAYGVNPAKSCIVNNCSRFSLRKKIIDFGQEIILGYHGRFAAVKRIERILEVANLLKSKRNIKVVLIGNGPEESKYIEYAKKLDINLELVEYTENPLDVIKTFDFEIISSVEEYFGISALESVISGVPTFIFKNSGGIEELFQNHKFFICEDINEMAEKLYMLIEKNMDFDFNDYFYDLQVNLSKKYSLDNFRLGYSNVYLTNF